MYYLTIIEFRIIIFHENCEGKYNKHMLERANYYIDKNIAIFVL